MQQRTAKASGGEAYLAVATERGRVSVSQFDAASMVDSHILVVDPFSPENFNLLAGRRVVRAHHARVLGFQRCNEVCVKTASGV